MALSKQMTTDLATVRDLAQQRMGAAKLPVQKQIIQLELDLYAQAQVQSQGPNLKASLKLGPDLLAQMGEQAAHVLPNLPLNGAPFPSFIPQPQPPGPPRR
jgi:hypothetical protein